jgi:hypothetical protein
VGDDIVLYHQCGNFQETARGRSGDVPKEEIFDGCGDSFDDVHGDPSILRRESIQTLDQSPHWVIQMGQIGDRGKELKSRNSKRFLPFSVEETVKKYLFLTIIFL